MNNVPNMISTKDLSYIQDIFNWNLSAYHKTILLINECSDKKLQNKLKTINKMYVDNMRCLANVLEDNK